MRRGCGEGCAGCASVSSSVEQASTKGPTAEEGHAVMTQGQRTQGQKGATTDDDAAVCTKECLSLVT
jgi:hypothetical protein